MNGRLAARCSNSALLASLGLTAQIGHAQTVACPAGVPPAFTQCANWTYTSWQYDQPSVGGVFPDLASAQAAGLAAVFPSSSYCSASLSGIDTYLCIASGGGGTCFAFGGQFTELDIAYGVNFTAPVSGPNPCQPGSNRILVGQFRGVQCPVGYTLLGTGQNLVGIGPVGSTLTPLPPADNLAACASMSPVSAMIKLVGLGTIEPGQPLSATALVTDGLGNPLAGAIVHLRVDAVPNSGGHMHGDDASPLRRGKLSGIGPEIVATAPTGADGSFSFIYAAPSVSGTYQITASCDDRLCTQVGQRTIDAKVDGLYTLAALSAYLFTGSTGAHPDNHYLTLSAAAVAQRLAIYYRSAFPLDPLLRYNDASLMWGGTFDITCAAGAAPCDWKSPHSEHKRGVVMDVKANGALDAIPTANYRGFRQLVRLLGGDPHYECAPALAHTKPCTEHFHVRLLGRAQ